MSFKIVQTKEPGAKGPLLSIVPTAWEKDGDLYWPPAKKKALIVKLIKDGNSRPEPDWIPQPCTKKTQTFLSYEAADLELTAMEQQRDSESSQSLEWPNRMGAHKRPEEELLPKKRVTNKNRMEVGRVPQADFNLLAEECKKAKELLFDQGNRKPVELGINESIENIFSQESSKKNGKASPIQQCKVVSENDSYRPKINIQSIKIAHQRNPIPETTPLLTENATSSAPHSDRFTSCQMMDFEDNGEFMCEVVAQHNIDEQIKLTINNQNTIMQNQNLLLENQMRIMEQLANQETMIQLICQQLSSTRIAASTSGALDITTESLESSDSLPIDSIAKLEQFEMDLRDETYMNKMIKCKSHICGTSGRMNGLNCSYRLIDSFFKRQFLLQFSWSGDSRNEEGKMAFKKYNNIMTTFYNIIRKADSNYTEMECQNFFKSVIKNAKRRFELSENVTGKRRESSGKKRPHNLNYQIKKKIDEIDQEVHTEACEKENNELENQVNEENYVEEIDKEKEGN